MTDRIFYNLAIISSFLVSVSLVVFIVIFGIDSGLEEKAISEEHIGIVSDKEMIEECHTLFNNTYEIGYQLVIKIEYEYDGETKTIEKKYNVERDVYLSYNVGDTFDIHNPIVKGSEESQC